MSENENSIKQPLTEIIDNAIKSAMQGKAFGDRKASRKQYDALCDVCIVLYHIIGKEIDGSTQVALHPAFSAGYVTVKVTHIKLDSEQINDLRSVLSKCTALSIEPLSDGYIEFGVTVPNVFEPLTE